MGYFTIVRAGLFGWLIWSEAPGIRSSIEVALVLLSGLLTWVIGKQQETANTPSQTAVQAFSGLR
jgi:drug/metabolite transporter (DMT)-like permease